MSDQLVTGGPMVDNRPSYVIRDVHQIEITSRCNLRCVYCVHPKMPRSKMDMTHEVFERALWWARTFVEAGTQQSLNLAGIGESTLHPDFVEFVQMARAAVGPHCDLVLATNGLLVTEEMAEALKPTRVGVFVSMHRPEKAGPAVDILNRAGILRGVSAEPVTFPIDWAGQVKWLVRPAKARPCLWVKGGAVFVMSDGTVSQCCLDGKGEEPIGSIWDDLLQLRTRPYTLCQACDQRLGIVGWDQARGAPTEA